jgi:hypothetical protein
VRVLETKAKLSLRHGGMAKFRNSRTGEMVTIVIEKFNPKTISGYEVKDGIHLRGRKWRVPPSLLTPVAEVIKQPPKPLGSGRDAPTSVVGQW